MVCKVRYLPGTTTLHVEDIGKKTQFSVSERKCTVVPNLMQSPCLLCSEVFKLVVYKNLTQLMHDCARIPPVFCTLALQVLPDSFVACLKNAIFSVTHKLGPCNPQCMQTKMQKGISHFHRKPTQEHT